MIAVAPGEVALTDRRTRHSWTVEVAPYLLAAVPVTQARYAAVTGQTPSAARGDDLPVERVSWVAAVRYCNALSERAALAPVYAMSADSEDVHWDVGADGYRLPTEAEWEYACRAGTTGARYGELTDIAWYRDNARGAVHAVGGKRPNAWGFHDMLGNVWEWCWDVYDREVYGSYRVLRGGGWADEHWSCRASVRRRSHPTLEIEDLGFRVARSTPSSAAGAGGVGSTEKQVLAGANAERDTSTWFGLKRVNDSDAVTRPGPAAQGASSRLSPNTCAPMT